MTLRVGIAGVGWGTIVHLPAFQAVDGFEVTALCARTPQRLAKVAAQGGIADVSTDWEEFVRRDDLDVISIATPVALHRPVALAALDAGKHVMCEKPLALTAAECAEMVDAARRAGTTGATCFELRWLPDRSRIRQLVRDGSVGAPYFVRLSQSGSYWHPSRPLQSLWMYDLEQGGGYLNGLLAHDIDFICSLFGRPAAVCADVRTTVATRPLPDGRTLDVTADDTSALILRLDSGALAVISASVVGVHTSGAHLDVFGERGSIVGPLGGRLATERLRAGSVGDAGLAAVEPDGRLPRHDDRIPERGASPLIRAMALMLEDWKAELDGQTTVNPIPSFADGMIVQQVIEAARLSSAGAGWVEIAAADARTSQMAT
jgi:predicted dehydrogenase